MLSVGEAPTVLEGLPDLAVMEGDTTVFECKISGEPLPSIRWSVNTARTCMHTCLHACTHAHSHKHTHRAWKPHTELEQSAKRMG